MYGLGLRVSRQARLAELAADTTLLDAAEGDPDVRVVGRVDPDHAGLDARRDAVRELEALAEDGGAQAVRRVVGHAHGLVLRLERRDDDERPEHLLAVDLHRVLDVGEDGWLDEVPLAVERARLPARRQRRALGLPGLDEAEHPLVLRLRHLRALERVLRERIADLARALDRLAELRHELVVHALVHQDAARRRADLALVAHDADVRPLGGLLNICVREYEQRGLAAGLEGDVLHVDARRLHDVLPCRRRSGEGDLVNAEVAG